MGRKVTLVCDFCGKEVETVAAKLYLAPLLPNKTITSFQSQYSHYADACSDCASGLIDKMKKRKPRERKSNVTPLRGKRRKAS